MNNQVTASDGMEIMIDGLWYVQEEVRRTVDVLMDQLGIVDRVTFKAKTEEGIGMRDVVGIGPDREPIVAALHKVPDSEWFNTTGLPLDLADEHIDSPGEYRPGDEIEEADPLDGTDPQLKDEQGLDYPAQAVRYTSFSERTGYRTPPVLAPNPPFIPEDEIS